MNLWTDEQVDVVAKRLCWKHAEPGDWPSLYDEDKEPWREEARWLLEALAKASGVEYAARASDGVGVKPCWDEANADRQVQQWRDHHGYGFEDSHVVVRVKAGAWVRRDPNTYQPIGTHEGATE